MHPRVRLLAVWLLALGSALVPSLVLANAPGWVRYTHPEKLLSARFPGKPTESVRDGITPNGPLHLEIAMWMEGKQVFAVTTGSYTSKAEVEIHAVLDQSLASLLRGLKGQVVTQKPMTLDGVEGRDVRFEAPGPRDTLIHGHVRLFATARPPRSYVVMSLQDGDDPSPDTQRFLDSFHLGKKAEAKP